MKIMRAIILDIETTGLSVPRGDRVIELGAVAVENGYIVDEMASLIDSGASINHHAFRVHGISAEMLVGKPTSQEIWPLFREFAGEAPLVAHNASFDSGFVRNELHRLGLPLMNSWHCTVKLARKKLPHLPNHRLDTVYRHLFGEIPVAAQRHRALDDARLAARVWMELT